MVLSPCRLLPSLEETLIGLEKGDKKEITVPPDKGFGDRREDSIKEFPKSVFDKRFKPSEGAVVELKHKDGNRSLTTVREVKENSVVLDFNHPLAGHTLMFDLEVIEISSK